MATWRELITLTMQDNNDSFDNVVAHTFNEDELDVEFDDGYGLERGIPFTLWTNEFVYFPITYDGSETAGSAPRNPCDTVLEHQGG
jgi:hypothetical protein